LIDEEFPNSRPAPDHTVSRRLRKREARDRDYTNPTNSPESALARPDAGKRAADRGDLYSYFCSVGEVGATREEAMLALGLHSNSGYPRCAELVHDGKLLKTGRRAKTRQGNWAAVLIADIHGGA